ncbi:MAG TPA: nitroreductase family protein [Flavobacteriales bacterium]|nr:nitroreductase family protein [Flavobacteriales bacterium]
MTQEKNEHPFIEYYKQRYSHEEMIARSKAYYTNMNTRRTVREFSSDPIPREVIENIILSAGTAPSGAHMQPWTFVAISDPIVKHKIREAAEREEFKSYKERMPNEWLEDIKPLGTDWVKPYLETAPWLIVVFRHSYRLKDGRKLNNYYVSESVGLACGFLLTAIHDAGLVALTHTPSPMNFLSDILKRPENEKPFLLIPVGCPPNPAYVPDIRRKTLAETVVFI